MVKGRFLIPYGVAIDDSESYIHIDTLNSDEHRGLNCNLVCVECGERLIARFPKTNPDFRSHFAHYVDRGCNISVESLIHKMAKQIIRDEKKMFFPDMIVSYKGFNQKAFDSQWIEFDMVTLESKRTTDAGISFIPDVVGTYGGVEVFIEIMNTHKVDIDKISKIKSYGAATIEVDVSMIDDVFDMESLKKAVLSSANNKTWLYLPKEQHIYNELKSRVKVIQKARDERIRLRDVEQGRRDKEAFERRETIRKDNVGKRRVMDLERERRQRELDSRRSDERRNVSHEVIAYYQDSTNADKWMRNMEDSLKKHSRYRYLDIDRVDNIFADMPSYSMKCHYKIWQAYVYDTFIEPGGVVSVKTVVDDLKQEFRNDVDYTLVFLNNIDKKDRVGIYDLTESVYQYLMTLVYRGYLEHYGLDSHKYYAKFKVK